MAENKVLPVDEGGVSKAETQAVDVAEPSVNTFPEAPLKWEKQLSELVLQQL